MGERTIILRIHSSYVEDFKVSDKISIQLSSGEKISAFGEIRYILLVTKLGEHTIILQIHSSYIEDFKISDKIG